MSPSSVTPETIDCSDVWTTVTDYTAFSGEYVHTCVYQSVNVLCMCAYLCKYMYYFCNFLLFSIWSFKWDCFLWAWFHQTWDRLFFRAEDTNQQFSCFQLQNYCGTSPSLVSGFLLTLFTSIAQLTSFVLGHRLWVLKSRLVTLQTMQRWNTGSHFMFMLFYFIFLEKVCHPIEHQKSSR